MVNTRLLGVMKATQLKYVSVNTKYILTSFRCRDFFLSCNGAVLLKVEWERSF